MQTTMTNTSARQIPAIHITKMKWQITYA